MFKTPKKDSIIDNAVKIGSAVGGGMLSNGAVEVAPVADNDKIYVRGGLAIAGLASAASVKSKTMAAKALQGALAGVAIEQTRQILTDLLSKTVEPATKEDTAAKRFLAASAGLNCGCQEPQVQMPMSLNLPFRQVERNYGVQSLDVVDANAFN